ncbi:hypothetical protein B0H14DRAFT_3871558 [Mycena olivaceomarginata]|nr:hypothetical protein B0H14DRAFT_3871558 [Mycena olivaceomarginata]
MGTVRQNWGGAAEERWWGKKAARIKGRVIFVRRVLQRRLLQLPEGSASPPAHTHAHVCTVRPPARIRADARRSRPTELWTPWTHAPLHRLITRIIVTGQLPLAWTRARCRRRCGFPRARRRGGIRCAVGVRNRDTRPSFASRLCMSRAGIAAMGIGKTWTGKEKRVWMKSEEEEEDKGRARGGPRGGRAADSRPKLRVGVAVRERGRERCDVDMGRACVRMCVSLKKGSRSSASRARRPICPLSLPAVVLQHLPRFYASDGEWDAEERVGFAAHGDAAKAARDRSSSSSSSSSSPSLSMRSMLLPPALHGHLPGLGHA